MAKHKLGPKQKTVSKVITTPAAGLRVSKGKLQRIDLDVAFPVVVQKQKSFFGHKAILFQGICAWVKHSRTNTASRKAIAKATARHIALAELEMTERISGQFKRRHGKATDAPVSATKKLAAAALGHVFAFSDERYRPLYVRVYLQIGGMKAVSDAFKGLAKHHTTKKNTKRARPKRESGIRYLVAIAAILDYHVRELSADPERYGRPNLSKAASLGGLLIKRDVHSKAAAPTKTSLGNSQVNELLAEHRKAFALLYGADRVTIAENKSLLDYLLSKAPVEEEIVPYIGEWLSYTQYFSENVLMKMKGEWKKTYSPSVPGVEPRQPPLPDISEDHGREIEERFSSKPGSDARLQFKKN